MFAATDVWHPNGGRTKSLPLLKLLDRVRDLLDKLMDCPELETGFYTTPLCEVRVETLHPLLTAEIGERSSLRGYYANVFCVPSADPFGCLEFFVDEQARQACGLFLIPYEFEQRIIGPGWTECGSDIDVTAQIFLYRIPDLNLVYATDEDEDRELNLDRPQRPNSIRRAALTALAGLKDQRRRSDLQSLRFPCNQVQRAATGGILLNEQQANENACRKI